MVGRLFERHIIRVCGIVEPIFNLRAAFFRRFTDFNRAVFVDVRHVTARNLNVAVFCAALLYAYRLYHNGKKILRSVYVVR